MPIISRSIRSHRSSQCARAGLLLVEAALAAAVIGVGLVFISRAFTSAMRTLEIARLTDTALLLAQQKLTELELEPDGAERPVFRSEMRGVFAEPYGAFAWTLSVQPDPEDPALAAGSETPMMVWMTVTVTPASAAVPVRVTLTTLAPQAWIPASWIS